MTEEKEVKKGESKVADAAWLRDTAERHRAFAREQRRLVYRPDFYDR